MVGYHIPSEAEEAANLFSAMANLFGGTSSQAPPRGLVLVDPVRRFRSVIKWDPFWVYQTMQIYGRFEGFPHFLVHCFFF